MSAWKVGMDRIEAMAWAHTLGLLEVTLLDSGLQGLVEQRVELGL